MWGSPHASNNIVAFVASPFHQVVAMILTTPELACSLLSYGVYVISRFKLYSYLYPPAVEGTLLACYEGQHFESMRNQ